MSLVLLYISLFFFFFFWHMSLPEILLYFYLMVYFDLLQGFRVRKHNAI